MLWKPHCLPGWIEKLGVWRTPAPSLRLLPTYRPSGLGGHDLGTPLTPLSQGQLDQGKLPDPSGPWEPLPRVQGWGQGLY